MMQTTHLIYSFINNKTQIFVTKTQNAVRLVKHLKNNNYKILKIRKYENKKLHIN